MQSHRLVQVGGMFREEKAFAQEHGAQWGSSQRRIRLSREPDPGGLRVLRLET